MNKKITTKISFSILIIFSIIFILTQINTATAMCNPLSTQSECGVLITTKGHGAVELCNNCFACGADDGVCPAWYSTGEIGPNMNVTLRLGNADRPSETTNGATIAYLTPKDACDQFGAQYLGEAYSKVNYAHSWTSYTLAETDIIDSTNRYIKVTCENVPKTPSCNICVDPDCSNKLTGMAYEVLDDGNTNIIENAVITILPQSAAADQTQMRREAVSNNQGFFEVENSYSGEVRVLCAAAGYVPTTQEVTLKPGNNIIDCKLAEAACTAECTLPSSTYGQEVCASECQGRGGCDFGGDYFMNACTNRPINYFYENNTYIDDGVVYVEGISCCKTPATKTYPLFNIDDTSDVSNLITRRYSKVLSDGTSVFLNIIVYNK